MQTKFNYSVKFSRLFEKCCLMCGESSLYKSIFVNSSYMTFLLLFYKHKSKLSGLAQIYSSWFIHMKQNFTTTFRKSCYSHSTLFPFKLNYLFISTFPPKLM